MNDPLAAFAPLLVAWQHRHGRHDLPWQKTRDPYRVWLSEIMLQQTQVASVVGYFGRFLERFPTLADLAGAPQEDVLEAWAGLGYYARARNLHRCARQLCSDHGGAFPRAPEALAALPGIGRSTAAAIAVFAFGERGAILDGNVKRVLARCFAIDGFPGAREVEKRLWLLAEALLPERDLEAYTQGLMDLGATVCTRGQPDCDDCPLRAICRARAEGRQAELPVARPRKVLPEREVTLMILSDGETVLLERRPASGIWGGLLSLPELPAGDDVDAFAARLGCQATVRHALPAIRHSFTHFHLLISPIYCRIERRPPAVGEGIWQWLAPGEIASAALPAPIARLLRGPVSTSYDLI